MALERNVQVCAGRNGQEVDAHFSGMAQALWCLRGKGGRGVVEGTGEKMILNPLGVQSVIASWKEMKRENRKTDMNQI